MKKIWAGLAIAVSAVLSSAPAYAATVVYDFDYVVSYSTDSRYTVGTLGTGRFAFEEAPQSEATLDTGLWGRYGKSAGYLDLTYNGITTRVVDYSGNLTGDSGPLMQDLPSDFFTWDLFRIGPNFGGKLSIFAPAPTITDFALTAENVDRLWANTTSATVEFPLTPNGAYTGGNIISLRAVAAVPEPATWAMMILGMGAVGFAMRRRKNLATNVTVRFA